MLFIYPSKISDRFVSLSEYRQNLDNERSFVKLYFDNYNYKKKFISSLKSVFLENMYKSQQRYLGTCVASFVVYSLSVYKTHKLIDPMSRLGNNISSLKVI